MKPCTQCGRCCTNSNFMRRMTATMRDLARWRKQRRRDILAYCYVMSDSADLWIKPNGHEADRCPFVRKQRGKDKYTCLIYDTRPEVCREYPWNVDHMKFVDCEMLEPGDTNADVAKFMGRATKRNESTASSEDSLPSTYSKPR